MRRRTGWVASAFALAMLGGGEFAVGDEPGGTAMLARPAAYGISQDDSNPRDKSPPASSGGPSEEADQPTAAPADGEADAGPLDLTFDDLKFDMEKDETFQMEMLTEDIVALSGKRIKLRGFIQPTARQSGIRKFVLVRDNQECCFGPGAALFDCVLVSLRDPLAIDYTLRPIEVEGELFIKQFNGADGRAWAIYRLKNAQVN